MATQAILESAHVGFGVAGSASCVWVSPQRVVPCADVSYLPGKWGIVDSRTVGADSSMCAVYLL